MFGLRGMAAGYATSRPPIHSRIIDRVAQLLGLTEPLDRALDVGCGAGLSTAPLKQIARFSTGIEPVEAMLEWTSTTARDACFAVGRAETLPVRSDSIDMITAAGSLNYVDLQRFLPEAVRVLRSTGALVVYDFSQGRSFRKTPDLDAWYLEFVERYPLPSDAATLKLDPQILASFDSGLQPGKHEFFEIGLILPPSFYVDYAMTETNVAHAIRNGASERDIRAWCSETVFRAFRGEDQEVLFRGYIACFRLLTEQRERVERISGSGH